VEAELKAKYPDARVELIKGSGGIFDVLCDDRLIYSKHRTRRFPDAGEVGTLIEEGTP
jgi:selT/selW/selH-like putative selenoprotein